LPVNLHIFVSTALSKLQSAFENGTDCHVWQRVIMRMSLFVFFACVLSLASLNVQAQLPKYQLGATLWEMDSVGLAAVPPGSDFVIVLRYADSAVLVLDARTGEIRSTLPGPRSLESFACITPITASPDGVLCMITEGKRIDDTSETTRLYDISTGQLLWQRKEIALVYSVSSALHRACVLVIRYPSPLSTLQLELVDTDNGRTVRAFGVP